MCKTLRCHQRPLRRWLMRQFSFCPRAPSTAGSCLQVLYVCMNMCNGALGKADNDLHCIGCRLTTHRVTGCRRCLWVAFLRRSQSASFITCRQAADGVVRFVHIASVQSHFLCVLSQKATGIVADCIHVFSVTVSRLTLSANSLSCWLYRVSHTPEPLRALRSILCTQLHG